METRGKIKRNEKEIKRKRQGYKEKMRKEKAKRKVEKYHKISNNSSNKRCTNVKQK